MNTPHINTRSTALGPIYETRISVEEADPKRIDAFTRICLEQLHNHEINRDISRYCTDRIVPLVIYVTKRDALLGKIPPVPSRNEYRSSLDRYPYNAMPLDIDISSEKPSKKLLLLTI